MPGKGTICTAMGLQQFERRLERMVEGVFARAFRGGLQPVEIGRRLTREMDLRRTVAPRGTLTPNEFVVVLSPADRSRFASIEDELIEELVAVARDHAEIERYSFVGPVSVVMETDEQLNQGMVLVSGEMTRAAGAPAGAGAPVGTRAPAGGGAPPGVGVGPGFGATGQVAVPAPVAAPAAAMRSRLLLPGGQAVTLADTTVTIGRLPDCGVVLADPNVSRVHAEVRPIGGGGVGVGPDYEIVDRGSTNGTRVNGLPLAGPRVLVSGDSITLGATTIGYERG
ncbi:MAG: DUF3662 and FHA domain-containing protein [Actinomycetota bacterium]|nr:DUF3662 and FHA domain-containing protein [Actinomycetota bacterium]